MMPGRRVRGRIAAIAAAGCLLAPAAARAQLPAPPVSAPAPVHLGGYGVVTDLRPATGPDLDWESDFATLTFEALAAAAKDPGGSR